MLLFHHLKGNALESYECELCGKKLTTFVTFRKHKKKHLMKQYKCTDENCTAIFNTSSSLLEHKKSCHYFQKSEYLYSIPKVFVIFSFRSLIFNFFQITIVQFVTENLKVETILLHIWPFILLQTTFFAHIKIVIVLILIKKI